MNFETLIWTSLDRSPGFSRSELSRQYARPRQTSTG